jgi:hypothetical protein
MTSCDIDGDGYSDLFVGADDQVDEYVGAGRVYVFRGQEGEQLTAPFSFRSPTPATSGFFGSSPKGHSLACTDLDGDGFSDLLVGAPFEGPGGRVYVFRGSPGFRGTEPPLVIVGTDNIERIGTVIRTGDFNGDGFGDAVIFGKPAVLHGGRAIDTALFPLVVPMASTIVSCASGDFDGDRFDDIAYVAGVFGQPSTIVVHFGSDAGLTALVPVSSLDGVPQVGAIGDVDGDGDSELAVVSGTLPGSLRMLSTTASTREWNEETLDISAVSQGRFGNSIAGL